MPGPQKGVRPRRLLPAEKERIIELKYQRVHDSEIARQVGTTRVTVMKTWRTHLQARMKDHRDDMETTRADVIARLERNASDARIQYQSCVEAEDPITAQRYLESERKAMVELAKLGVIYDLEPEQQARIAAAQATAVARVVRAAIGDAGLNADQSRVVLKAVATRIREIEQ